MATQLPDQLTPLSYPVLIEGLKANAPEATPAGRILLAAHIGFETGLRACHRWNLGNVKWTLQSGVEHFCQFACGEEVTQSVAEKLKRDDPGLVQFRGAPYKRGALTMQSVWLLPPHPWTSFRAFTSLEEGLADHLRLFRGRKYGVAWSYALQGNVAMFVEELRVQGYFTGSDAQYLAGVKREITRCRGTLMGKPTLRIEERGTLPPEAVKLWQREALGFQGDDVDGDFGPATEHETILWQGRHHLNPDGSVGPISWATAFPAAEVVA